ncbi:MAG: carboxymuconolactone decarboxylase family protein [Burkholderiales bacterium]|nr:carboxymuconolactone decarboxylase family protein [Burkholderiales bacterium]
MFAAYEKSLGFVPNSALVMQRKPAILRAFAQLSAAINADPGAEVDRGFKRLLAHLASRTAGCQYCMAHTVEGAAHQGVAEAKLSAIWEYRTSPLYSAAERVALDFALAAAAVPNDVTDAMFAELKRHWTESQIVEIVAVIALFGFLNRWNDTFATPLEEEAIAAGEKYLARGGWQPGKHLAG